ncbi:MAG: autotransporter-associated N-terminal domain-containing protein, partial [Fusobacteriaceae bacterium]|nr:autotransporter-associated N-terminal domain-containing protein [Fusobacteriaceae bacterium]
MDTNVKSNVEKLLKQNLKRKMTYTVGLLVSFLITGSCIFASSAELQTNLVESQIMFETNVQIEKEHVLQLIKDNEARREAIWSDYQELIRKGDFYAKPFHPSFQFFFDTSLLVGGKYKNRTKSEWKSTIDDVDYKLSGGLLPKGKNPYHDGEVIAFAKGGMENVSLPSGYSYNKNADEAAYDIGIGGYNPNLTPETLTGAAAAKYIKPVYTTDASGVITKTIPGGAPSFTDSYGNSYFVVSDASGTYTVDSVGKVVEIDANGNVVMANTLLDPNINGSGPKYGNTLSFVPLAVGEALLDAGSGLVVDGNGVFIDALPYGEALDVGANIKLLDPGIPVVSKDVTVSVTPPPGVNPPGAPATPGAPNPVTVNVTKPTVDVSAPAAVGKVDVGSPTIGGGITAPTAPSVGAPSLDVPTFVPRVIDPPATPGEPAINPITPVPIIVSTSSGGNNDIDYFWSNTSDPTNEFGSGSLLSAIMSQVLVKKAKWNIVMDSSTSATAGYKTKLTGYEAFSIQKNSTDTASHGDGTTIVGGGLIGIYQVVGTPYALFDVGTEVNITSGRASTASYRMFIFYDAHANRAMKLTDTILVNNASVSEINFVSANISSTKTTINTDIASLSEYYQILSLRGNITVDGNRMIVVGLQPHRDFAPDSKGVPVTLNSGTITLNGNRNIGLAYVAESNTNNERHLFMANWKDGVRAGKIEIKGGNENIGVYFGGVTGNNGNKKVYHFKNTGEIVITNGNKNVGLYLNQMINGGYVELDKSIEIKDGEENIAVLQYNGTSNVMDADSYLKATISGGTKNIGYYGKINQTINNHEFIINGTATSSVGVYTSGATAADGDLILGTGKIEITSGSKNVGIYASAGDVTTGGDVIVGGGRVNTAVYVEGTAALTPFLNSNTVTINGSSTILASDSIPFYAKGIYDAPSTIAYNGTIKINGTLDITLIATSTANTGIITGEGTIGLFANDYGVINALGTTKKITITGGADNDGNLQGSAVYAFNSGKISLQNSTISVTGGPAAIISTATTNQTGTAIDLTGSTVTYDGVGIALYAPYTATVRPGLIDMSGATLILKGKAIGWEKDLSIVSDPPITFVTGINKMTLDIRSDDVIVVELKGVTNLIVGDATSSPTVNPLIADIGLTDVNFSTDSSNFKYKWAAVDGGNILIEKDISRLDNEDVDGGIYFKRFLGQRQKLTVDNGVTVTATLDNTEDNIYGDKVVGLEMSSSKAGKDATGTIRNNWIGDTSITLNTNSKIIADRTDTGAGAIGAYINYGTITNNGTIEVENLGNTINDKAVGIFAVNGSVVVNNTAINVAGNKSVGIFAQTRNGTVESSINEFGTTVDIATVGAEGRISVTNSGTIDMTVKDNTGNIGIYARNNNSAAGSGITTATVANTGIIRVGSDGAIGIYGVGTGTAPTYRGVGISSINGIIYVVDNSDGTRSIGIYATKGSAVFGTNLGTFHLGKNAIGIAVDRETLFGSEMSYSSIAAITTGTPIPTDINLFSNYGTEPGADEEKGAIGIVVPAPNSLTPYKTAINVNTTVVDANKFFGGTIFYLENTALFSSGTLNVAKNGIGMYLNNGVAANAKNTPSSTNGIINLIGVNAIGLYTKKGALGNQSGATINIKLPSQAGMYVDGSGNPTISSTTIPPNIDGGFAYNNGDIVLESGASGTPTLSISGAVGIYAVNKAHVSLNQQGTI